MKMKLMLIFSVFIISVIGNAQEEQETKNEPADLLSAPIDTKKETLPTQPRLSKNRIRWNEFDYDDIWFVLGGGYLTDTASYKQDSDSQKQMKLSSATKLRDFRIITNGKFKKIDGLTFKIGYMYDGPLDDWNFRQTGLGYEMPSLNSNIFVGRTKEGFSTIKYSTGYYLWPQERAAISDAFLPIVGNGIRWDGRTSNHSFLYNIGYYNETIFSYDTFDKNDEIVALRTVFLPFADKKNKQILHFALEGRYGTSKQGTLQYKANPESHPAQEAAIDTGKFPAKDSRMGGVEFYYIPGSFMIGSEYYFNQVKSVEKNDPYFHGGEIFATYFLTGESHPYDTKFGIFKRVQPARPVFTGGPGAVELVLRYSYADLKDEAIDGGVFQRISPHVNWYMSEWVKFSLDYGYSTLDRKGVTGETFYVQSRLQLIVL